MPWKQVWVDSTHKERVAATKALTDGLTADRIPWLFESELPKGYRPGIQIEGIASGDYLDDHPVILRGARMNMIRRRAGYNTTGHASMCHDVFERYLRRWKITLFYPKRHDEHSHQAFYDHPVIKAGFKLRDRYPRSRWSPTDSFMSDYGREHCWFNGERVNADDVRDPEFTRVRPWHCSYCGRLGGFAELGENIRGIGQIFHGKRWHTATDTIPVTCSRTECFDGVRAWPMEVRRLVARLGGERGTRTFARTMLASVELRRQANETARRQADERRKATKQATDGKRTQTERRQAERTEWHRGVDQAHGRRPA